MFRDIQQKGFLARHLFSKYNGNLATRFLSQMKIWVRAFVRFFLYFGVFLDSAHYNKLVLAREALVSLLGDGELDASTSGQRDVRLLALADDEDVSHAGGESVAVGVLDVDDVEWSRMPLAVDDVPLLLFLEINKTTIVPSFSSFPFEWAETFSPIFELHFQHHSHVVSDPSHNHADAAHVHNYLDAGLQQKPSDDSDDRWVRFLS